MTEEGYALLASQITVISVTALVSLIVSWGGADHGGH